MERATEFLLRSQADPEARVGRLGAAQGETNRQIAETSRQLAETSQRLDSFADTQAALMRGVTETFAAQNRINEEVRRNLDRVGRGWVDLGRGQEAARAAIHRVSDRQDRAVATVERLAEAVRRHAAGGDETSRG